MKITQDCLFLAMQHYEGKEQRKPGTLAPDVSALVGPWLDSRGGPLEFGALSEHVRGLLLAVPGLVAPAPIATPGAAATPPVPEPKGIEA